ncbi:MAG: hypothetical protein KGJ86_17845, partial [Chloroflexota bacterium]|nr:hypothetical protein [Chloroflexota bacterium]
MVSSKLSQVPLTTVDGLVRVKRETGDAYSGRLVQGRHSLVTFQLDYDEESLYQAFDETDLNQYAEALRRCFLQLGLRAGDTIALVDFGTSPVVYLASVCYTPYLSQGAADALGCQVVCNDGVANVSQRGVEIL